MSKYDYNNVITLSDLLDEFSKEIKREIESLPSYMHVPVGLVDMLQHNMKVGWLIGYRDAMTRCTQIMLSDKPSALVSDMVLDCENVQIVLDDAKVQAHRMANAESLVISPTVGVS